MVELNKTINWKPESTGTGRWKLVGEPGGLELVAIRYWGLPFPSGRPRMVRKRYVSALSKKLKSEIERHAMQASQMRQLVLNKPDFFDLHRPFMDEIVLYKSPKAQPHVPEADLY